MSAFCSVIFSVTVSVLNTDVLIVVKVIVTLCHVINTLSSTEVPSSLNL